MMHKYSFQGQCPENREMALSEVESILKNHGSIVAFHKANDASLNLMIEVPEMIIEKVVFRIGKYMNLSEENNEISSACEDCQVLNLFFSN